MKKIVAIAMLSCFSSAAVCNTKVVCGYVEDINAEIEKLQANSKEVTVSAPSAAFDRYYKVCVTITSKEMANQ